MSSGSVVKLGGMMRIWRVSLSRKTSLSKDKFHTLLSGSQKSLTFPCMCLGFIGDAGQKFVEPLIHGSSQGWILLPSPIFHLHPFSMIGRAVHIPFQIKLGLYPRLANRDVLEG